MDSKNNMGSFQKWKDDSTLSVTVTQYSKRLKERMAVSLDAKKTHLTKLNPYSSIRLLEKHLLAKQKLKETPLTRRWVASRNLQPARREEELAI